MSSCLVQVQDYRVGFDRHPDYRQTRFGNLSMLCSERRRTYQSYNTFKRYKLAQLFTSTVGYDRKIRSRSGVVHESLVFQMMPTHEWSAYVVSNPDSWVTRELLPRDSKFCIKYGCFHLYCDFINKVTKVNLGTMCFNFSRDKEFGSKSSVFKMGQRLLKWDSGHYRLNYDDMSFC